MDEKDLFSSVRLDLLALAFAGALTALSFWPTASLFRALLNLAIGTTISAVSVPALIEIMLWFWPTFPSSPSIYGIAYFWLGLLGMQLVPVVLVILNRLKNIRISERD